MRASKFLGARELEPKERVSASRKLGRTEAVALLKAASHLYVSKGKKTQKFDVRKSVPKDAVDAMLGSTGNLRAPTLRVGKTILVGFNDEVYESVFG